MGKKRRHFSGGVYYVRIGGNPGTQTYLRDCLRAPLMLSLSPPNYTNQPPTNFYY
jgi:hypothetical protein